MQLKALRGVKHVLGLAPQYPDRTENQVKQVIIKSGDAALDLLKGSTFREKWATLYERCPWATSCQHESFVMPWYALYQETCCPLIAFAENDDGTLAGLWTLALYPASAKITAAGGIQAEYQGWLELPATDNRFVRAAVTAIRQSFTGADICLKYLPASAPVGWLDDLRKISGLYRLKRHMRPLMEIDENKLTKQLHKRKNALNRLKKHGEIRFEQITDHDRFIAFFGAICDQYDQRQSEVHHIHPFRDDPFKKPFHIELHRRGLLHTTVLTAGDLLIASQSGLVSKGCLHICINTHDEQFAQQSPGILHLMFLRRYLTQQGVPLMDLTPGSSPYKEYLATSYDEVFELVIYGNLAKRLTSEATAALRQGVKKSLSKAGMAPATVRTLRGRLLRQ